MLWSEFRHVGPLSGRFDHHVSGPDGRAKAQAYGVLYAGMSPIVCLAEVFQRNRTIDRWTNDPWLVGFGTAIPLKLLDLTGAFPTRAGASMALMTGARSAARRWATAFHRSYVQTQGILYPPSMVGNSAAVVLNERAEQAGVLPGQPSFHRALADPALLTALRNISRQLGYVLV